MDNELITDVTWKIQLLLNSFLPQDWAKYDEKFEGIQFSKGFRLKQAEAMRGFKPNVEGFKF